MDGGRRPFGDFPAGGDAWGGETLVRETSQLTRLPLPFSSGEFPAGPPIRRGNWISPSASRAPTPPSRHRLAVTGDNAAVLPLDWRPTAAVKRPFARHRQQRQRKGAFSTRLDLGSPQVTGMAAPGKTPRGVVAENGTRLPALTTATALAAAPSAPPACKVR
jgi:hypothetical protein